MRIPASFRVIFVDCLAVPGIEVLVIRIFPLFKRIRIVRMCLGEYHKIVTCGNRLEAIAVGIACFPLPYGLCYTTILIFQSSAELNLRYFHNRIPAHEISCIGRGRILREQACSLIAHP